MKKTLLWIILISILILFCGCGAQPSAQIAATTLPVYEFTSRLCEGTGITVGRVVTENVSCLHDYSLQVSQMRMVEEADAIVISGGGLEDFLADVLADRSVIDASQGITLSCPEEEHEHDGHHHETDPHFWLSPTHAKTMVQNIYFGLSEKYPEHTEIFQENLYALISDLDALQLYGTQELQALEKRQMITFHDGFSYFAESFQLDILKAIEEESGQEASAAELKELIGLVNEHQLTAVFTEINGSCSAADVIAAETGCALYNLDMVMSGDSYFAAMYHNIDTVKEALG